MLRNQFLKNLALMVALAWFPYGAQARFLTKNPTTNVSQELRCMNIQQRICKSAHLDAVKFNTLGPDAVYDRMKEILGEKPRSCKLTLNKDGSVLDVSVIKSSSSKSLDTKALNLIRSAQPFYSSKFLGPHAYIIEFPILQVTPAAI